MNGGNNCSLSEEGVTLDIVVPVTLSKAETILHLICLSQGIPINLLIGIVIVHNRRLHNPRNTFWLGIIVLNLLTMFMAVLKLMIVYFAENNHHQAEHYTCLIFSFMTGKPYTILLFIMLLATLDRYVAITYPLYHRKHVTVRLVIFVQIACFFAVFFLLSMPFVFGWIPLCCGFNMSLGKWTMLMRSVLVTLCIAFQIKVYFVTRKYLRQAEVEPISVPMQQLTSVAQPGNNKDAEEPVESVHELSVQGVTVSDEHQKSLKSNSMISAAKSAPFFVHRRNKTISKLELEASLTLVVGALSLCFITAPMFIVYFAISICQYMGGECKELVYSVPYVRQAALIHSVYGPLIYMIRSREFAAAVRKMLRPSSQISINYF